MDAQLDVEAVFLRADADARAGSASPGWPGSMPRIAQRAAGDRRDGADHPHRRRLACAVGAEEAERLALLDLDVDALDRLELAVGLAQPTCLDQRLDPTASSTGDGCEPGSIAGESSGVT